MSLKYKYRETEQINGLIIKLEALKIVFENLKVLPQVEQNLRRESLLKSSVYSARVEGNPLLPESIDTGEKIHKLEISNLLTSYNFIYSDKISKKLSIGLIKKMHSLVMKNISGNAGKFRDEPWGIFNSAGIAVYLAPAHFNVPTLMDEFIDLEREIKEIPSVKSAIMQFLFEKIHPFADGNGRVGRLISTFIMDTNGYGFKSLIPVEEVIDDERSLYYRTLEPSHDVTNFVEFFLESFIKKAAEVLEKASNIKTINPEDELFLRRQEIFRLIKDHPYCSFNFISRRFSKVNPKTLHYDIKKLIDSQFIIKIGETRGATYLVKNM